MATTKNKKTNIFDDILTKTGTIKKQKEAMFFSLLFGIASLFSLFLFIYNFLEGSIIKSMSYFISFVFTFLFFILKSREYVLFKRLNEVRNG